MSKNVRCYPIQTYQNKSKNITLLELYKEYKIFFEYMIKIQYRLYQETGYLNKSIDVNHLESKLSERYKRCATYQVVGMLQSWLSNRDNKIKDIIHNNDSLSDKEKRILHIIRRSNIKKETIIKILHNKINKKKGIKKGDIKEELLIPKEYIQIYKSILRQIKWRLPSCRNISMLLNDNVSKLIKSGKGHKKLNAVGFEHWIELSTLTKGEKAYFPVNINNYVKEQLGKGKRLNALRIDFKGSDIIFNIMIDKEVSEDYEAKIDSIGIDFGTKHLFALSTGNIFGVNFGKQLKSYDDKISILQKRLQHQKIKPNQSKRYRNLVKKCRAFIKNEINRNFNKIIKELNPQVIVLESLDFRHSKLNKTMNRILRKCGRSVIKSKITMLEKDYGIKIIEVNPAYTSQTCNKCGFVHKLNRNNRDKLKCKNCNHIKQADINASKNIRERSSCSVLKGKSGKRTIKKHLFNSFKQNILQCGVHDRCIKYTSPNSRAIFLDFNPQSFLEFYGIISQEIN